MKPDNSIEFEIIGFKGTNAILQNKDLEIGTINWPIQKLPEEIKEGDKIYLKIDNNEEQYTIKRRLLEELVN